MTEEVMLVTQRKVGHRAAVAPSGAYMTAEACNLDQSTTEELFSTDLSLPSLQKVINGGVRLCKRCFKNELASMELYD